MFESIIKFFKAISVLLSSTARASKQATDALNNSLDEIIKKNEISRDKALVKHKEHRAQMAKDAGYESVEDMDREFKKLNDDIFK